jgi:hypothetical protein
MTNQLRIARITVTTELVWDDGEELTPGPQLQPISVPLSRLAEFGQTLPAEVAALAAKLEAERAASGDEEVTQH